jgi:hypothetical protein
VIAERISGGEKLTKAGLLSKKAFTTPFKRGRSDITFTFLFEVIVPHPGAADFHA